MIDLRYIRNFSLIFSIVVIFFFSGCIDFGGGDDTEVIMFVGGDDALTIDFIGSNPPDRIFQNREFDIAMIVRNEGEHLVKAGELSLRLNGASDLSVSPDDIIKTNTEDLTQVLKAGEGHIPGGVEYIGYENLKYVGRNVLTEESPLAISIEACYPYETLTVSTLCVTTTADSTICDFLEERELQNSGAPITISSIEQQGNFKEGDTVYSHILITMEQNGDGDVYYKNSDCNSLNVYNLSRVTIESISLGNDVWTSKDRCVLDPNFKNPFANIICEPISSDTCEQEPQCMITNDIIEACGQDTFRLAADGETSALCEIPIENVVSDYEERLVVVLGYKHTQLVSKDISIMPARWE